MRKTARARSPSGENSAPVQLSLFDTPPPPPAPKQEDQGVSVPVSRNGQGQTESKPATENPAPPISSKQNPAQVLDTISPPPAREGDQHTLGSTAQSESPNASAAPTARPTPSTSNQDSSPTIAHQGQPSPTTETSATSAQDTAPPATSPTAVIQDQPQTQTESIPRSYVYEAIDDEGLLGKGPKQRFRDNIAAITTLKVLETEHRDPSAEEQHTLAQYVGWGGIKGPFEPDTKTWQTEQQTVKTVLSDDERESAERSVLNAHFTHPHIVKSMWAAVKQLGFTGGRVLEPSAGIGYFLGHMPEDLRQHSQVDAVELDNLSARIGKQLYPGRYHEKGYEEHKRPDGYYDLAIGNVPFGEYGVHDARYNQHHANIHDYFFLKSVDQVREGGVIAFITSTGTMDKASRGVRRALAERTELIGAFRLPEGSHKDLAQTQVVSDIIFLQRTNTPKEPDWIDSEAYTRGNDSPHLNTYYSAHRDHILGDLEVTTGQYGKQLTVHQNRPLEQVLERVLRKLPSEPIITERQGPEPTHVELSPDLEGLREGSHVVHDGLIQRKRYGLLEPVDLKSNDKRRFASALTIRDALNDLFQAEVEGHSQDRVADLRVGLNRTYDAFVEAYGPLSQRKNSTLIIADPDAPKLLALEDYDPATKSAAKRPIFFQSTIRPRVDVSGLNTLESATGAALDADGALSPERVADMLNQPQQQVEAELVKRGIAYPDPDGGWQPASLYLSGNTRTKLQRAEQAASEDPKWAPNVEALRTVQPEDIAADDIHVRMGAPWIPPSDIEHFAEHLMQSPGQKPVQAVYLKTEGSWEARWTEYGTRHRSGSALDRNTYGTSDKSFPALLQHALNQTQPYITRPTDDGKRVLDSVATEQAQGKVAEITKAFESWIWEDDERRSRLHRSYNDTYNAIVPVHYDGSHLSFPGLAPTFKGREFSLRQHQKDAVWQGLVTGRAWLGHEVGTGKTLTMGALAMESRRLGKAHKPAIAGLKANIDDIAADIAEAYPAASILKIDKFDPDNRKQLVARMATGDYDLIVMTHDQLNMLPMRPDAEIKFISDQKADLREAMMAMGKEDTNNRSVRRMQKRLASLDTKLKGLLDAPKDDGVTFEETGIDLLIIDEAQQYKSLPIITKHQGVKGIPTSASKRSTSMLMRSQYLYKQNDDRGLIMATGTPVSNTLAEVYNFQRYLQPKELEEAKVKSFDAWMSTFGEVETKLEKGADGVYKPASRLSKFVNIPELKNMASLVLDVRFADDMPEIRRPKRKDEVVALYPSDAQRDLIVGIRERAKNIKEGNVEPHIDNYLKLSSDGRKGALDMRLISPEHMTLPREEMNKVEAMTERALAIHKANPGKTQMIFSDLGVNETEWGWSVYNEVKKGLIAGGINPERIIDFTKLNKKDKPLAAQKLFNAEADFGIGSTERMGTGVNAQQHLVALHHVDAPWRPSDIEQRDGRGYRQGNTNESVHILRYVTKDTFDEVMWGKLATKKAFIRQFLTKEAQVQRTMKEESGDQLSYEEIQAIASGDPRILKQVELQQQVDKLERAAAAHRRAEHSARDRAYGLRISIERDGELSQHLRTDAQTANAHRTKEFHITIAKQTYSSVADAAEALQFAQEDVKEHKDKSMRHVIGEYRGLQITYKPPLSTSLQGATSHPLRTDSGDPTSLVRSMVTTVAGFSRRADQLDTLNAKRSQERDSFLAGIGKPFEHGDLMKEKRETLRQLTKDILKDNSTDDGEDDHTPANKPGIHDGPTR